jgi:error-prone DNA polymerase
VVRLNNFVHLHARSWFSFQRGASSPDALVQTAVANSQSALALTDYMTVAGCVRFQQSARAAGIKPIIGAEVLLESNPTVLLCASNAGYATLCRLLSRADQRRTPKQDSFVSISDLEDDHTDLFLLTGGRDSFLRAKLEAQENHTALEWLKRLKAIMPNRMFVEISSHHHPGDARMVSRLINLARVAGVPMIASNDVRYATRADLPVYDLLTCVRLGITVHDDHLERPINDEAYLKSEAELRELIFEPSAFANTLEIARECSVDLLREAITPPNAIVPVGESGDSYLERLCRVGLKRRYEPTRIKPALEQLERELQVIGDLGLSEFFLTVAEVVQFAKSQGIRCSGRGSAASSIVSYLLEISQADPLKHRLVFERFLHYGRQGTPDIDVDFASSRRQEVIEWITERFAGHTAMTANINTFGLRGAVRDSAKALGWSLEVVNEMTKVLSHHGTPADVAYFRDALESVVGPSSLLEVLLEIVVRLEGCPRHLSLHSGGMLLTREPITNFSSVQRSANGTLQVVLDKDDAEAVGLVKLDILGLRTLDVIAGAVDLLEANGISVDVNRLDLEDPRVYDLICRGEVIGLFQIESPGQQQLIAKHQPTSFRDLVAEVALLRPGPIQAEAVHPYVRRRTGLEAVTYPHHALEPILESTFGTMIFQDQGLEVAQHFAGMPLDEADRFRKLMSKARDPVQMEAMRDRFVQGSMQTQPDLDLETANKVFDMVRGFTGYGFPRAHSVAFATIAFQTAWLKAYYPAAYLASVMQFEPGMFNRMTITQEARRFGVPILPASLKHSGLHFGLEHHHGKLSIRLPLTAVTGIGEDHARAILLERAAQPFTGLEDFVRRVHIGKDVVWALGKANVLEPFGERRDVLWKLGILLDPKAAPRGLGSLQNQIQPRLDLPTLLELPGIDLEDLPNLELLTELEGAVWDMQSLRTTAGSHPMAIIRPNLERAGILRITRANEGIKTVAGLVIVRQRPMTAKGVVFITLEDESGHCQCIASAELWAVLKRTLQCNALIVTGLIQCRAFWRGLIIHNAVALKAVGGRAGSPRAAG